MTKTEAGARLRVAMVTYQFPPMFAGGARHALELARALGAHGVESFFIGANLKNAPAREIYEGFAVHRFTPRGPGRIRYLTYALQVCKKLLAEKSSFDIVHLHSLRPFYFLILGVARALGKPVVLSPTLIGHDDPMALKEKPFLWRVEGKMYGRYDRIVCKSSGLRESCLKAGLPDALLVSIPGAVPCAAADSPFHPARDVEEVREIRRALGLPQDSFVAAFVGHVQERKGCDLLFDAWEKLAAGGFAGHLLLVGPYPGDMRTGFGARLKSVMEKAERNNMIFTGQVDYADVPRYLRASDCFVFPSQREGLSKAVIEAMASGLPALCARIPGVTEDMIDDGADGIILDRRDPAALAGAIQNLKEDEGLRRRLAAGALAKVREKFSLADVTRRHLDLYRELLDPAARSRPNPRPKP